MGHCRHWEIEFSVRQRGCMHLVATASGMFWHAQLQAHVDLVDLQLNITVGFTITVHFITRLWIHLMLNAR
jgi:hypothetical protein